MVNPRICAHRGITTGFEQNTIEAITEAARHGVDMVEFDTQVTKDGVWILFHDQHIIDEETLIKDLRYDEFMELAEVEGKPVDLLDDLLDQIHGIDMNIECKSESFEAGSALAEVLTDYEYDARLNVSSFSRPALRGMYSTNPDLKLSYLGYYVPDFRWYLLHRKVPLYSINPYITLVHRLKVISAHRRGLEVHVWTANTTKQIMKCLKIGVDVIITDETDKAIELRSQYLKQTIQS